MSLLTLCKKKKLTPIFRDFILEVAERYNDANFFDFSYDENMAFAAFKSDLIWQYREMLNQGFTVERSTEHDICNIGADEWRKIAANGVILINIDSTDNPPAKYLTDTLIDGFTVNEVLWAVHDFFGHYVPVNDFDTFGEIAANVAHAKMFSEHGCRFLFAEQLAQTCATQVLSWAKYGNNYICNYDTQPIYAQQKPFVFGLGMSNIIFHFLTGEHK